MAQIAIIVTILALAGALASWIAGVRIYLWALRAVPDRKPSRSDEFAAVIWPFTRDRLGGTPDDRSSALNKALVAFLTCLMVAVTATSLATNLSRLSR